MQSEFQLDRLWGWSCPWLLLVALLPFHQESGRGGALGPAVSWAGQVNKVVTLQFVLLEVKPELCLQPSQVLQPNAGQSPTQSLSDFKTHVLSQHPRGDWED